MPPRLLFKVEGISGPDSDGYRPEASYSTITSPHPEPSAELQTQARLIDEHHESLCVLNHGCLDALRTIPRLVSISDFLAFEENVYGDIHKATDMLLELYNGTMAGFLSRVSTTIVDVSPQAAAYILSCMGGTWERRDSAIVGLLVRFARKLAFRSGSAPQR